VSPQAYPWSVREWVVMQLLTRRKGAAAEVKPDLQIGQRLPARGRVRVVLPRQAFQLLGHQAAHRRRPMDREDTCFAENVRIKLDCELALLCHEKVRHLSPMCHTFYVVSADAFHPLS
jgi:hypothetical protein